MKEIKFSTQIRIGARGRENEKNKIKIWLEIEDLEQKSIGIYILNM